MSVLIQYALLNDKKTPVHVRDAVKDRHFKYYCEECKEELVLRDGLVKQKHFSHKPSTNCEVSKKGNGESIVHKYWKNHFASRSFIDLPYYELNEDQTDLTVQTATYNIKMAVTEKTFTLKNGKSIRPDIVLTLEDGRDVALEICYKSKKTYKHIQAFAELGLTAYEVRVYEDKACEVKVLYSEGKILLTEQIQDNKVQKDKDRASTFTRSIYEIADKWEKKNRFIPTVKRYTYFLYSQHDDTAYRFRTTYKTYLQVVKSYGKFYKISMSGNLQNRIAKDELKLLG